MLLLKQFQAEAIDSAVSYFQHTLALLNANRGAEAGIIKKAGYCLIEAPTGAGKTLIAGHIAENISKIEKILWFWFTPFSGLVEQAGQTIKSEFCNLTLKNLYRDRQVENLSSGDIFVATWSSVASAKKDSRIIRKTTETAVGLDEFIELAKLQGFHVGVIIDEAHHSFKKATEAQKFYTTVLNPSLSLLITATPNDKDIDDFQKLIGISNIEKLSIGRSDCVSAHLIKKGIKATAFLSDKWTSSLIDLNKTAIHQGVEIHNRIKTELKNEGLGITPLMLIQVDSSKDSIENTKKYLSELGFSSEQIAVHTADEPDPDLISIAHDENKEVLIFKMAVALGFDAPRAFTLVSLRSSRDIGFGIQIVGRILRVDRRLQGKQVPSFLDYGYVVMLDENTQEGLALAADRINAIKTELSTASPNVTLIDMIPDEAIIEKELVDKSGNDGYVIKRIQSTIDEYFLDDQFDVSSFANCKNLKLNSLSDECLAFGGNGFRHQLNPLLQVPELLYKEIYSLRQRDIVPCIARQIDFNDTIFSLFLKDSTSIIKKEIEIFEHLESIESGLAYLSGDKIAQKAQEIIFSKEFIDGKSLYEALLERMRSELFSRGFTRDLDPGFISSGLNIAIALQPELLDNAIKKCILSFIDLAPVSLPMVITSEMELKKSRLNAYGIYSEDLNRWELEFAKMLDRDTTGTILWWHRNPVRKDYSIAVVEANLRYDFYPDFIIGVKNREHANNVLLVEIKGTINRDKNELFKSRASHKIYKNVMMLFWEQERSWYTVKYDSKHDSNMLDQRFRIELMSDF